jgi:hypothetical protein
MEAKLKTDRRGEPGIARAGGQAAGASSILRIDTRLASHRELFPTCPQWDYDVV